MPVELECRMHEDCMFLLKSLIFGVGKPAWTYADLKVHGTEVQKLISFRGLTRYLADRQYNTLTKLFLSSKVSWQHHRVYCCLLFFYFVFHFISTVTNCKICYNCKNWSKLLRCRPPPWRLCFQQNSPFITLLFCRDKFRRIVGNLPVDRWPAESIL